MTVMENFGSYLKHERELRGIPLEEIADNTKIHMRFLEALENNRFDSLPGEVFIKGYIRSYAKSIGTNAEEMLAAYDEAIGKHRREQMFKLESEKNLVIAKQKNLKNIAILCISLAVIAAGGFYLNRFVQQKSKSTAQKNAAENASLPAQTTPETDSSPNAAPLSSVENASAENPAPDSSAEPPASQDDLSAKATSANSEETASSTAARAANTNPVPPTPKPVAAKKTEDKPASEKTVALQNKDDIIQPVQEQPPANVENEKNEPSGQGRFTLTIQTQENSWFNLVIDGNTEKDFILPGGNKKQFRGDESFTITIGNRKGVLLFLNGKAVDLPEGSDNVIRKFAIHPKDTE